MYTNEQVQSLARIFKALNYAIYGDKGHKQMDLDNATRFPMREVTRLTTLAHAMHKVTPQLDRMLAYEYSSYFPVFDPEEYSKSFTTCMTLEQQGVFMIAYMQYDATQEATPTGIKAMCKKANITLTELANQMGVTLRQVQRWDSGESSPNIKDAQKVAGILGCSVNDIF